MNLKNTFFNYYEHTFKELYDKILQSDVLYVDETPLKMRYKDGYAWVLTNNKEIVSIYKETREASIIKNILCDYKGILVSDFYTAYDSLDCVQQKCLIHLIRDMNDDLLKNPFNTELYYITQNFTSIMQEIIKTIDRYGLRKRFLKKYWNQCKILIEKITSEKFATEIAIYYQERFLRNKNKLFTFLEYDNVSWNNNNAEKAIKLLATHTNEKIKLFSEKRISEYLCIMSIYQTCIYKPI